MASLSSTTSFFAVIEQNTQKDSKPLTNADILDMLNSGVSQDIVIAKIKKSACEFDTSPEALKALKVVRSALESCSLRDRPPLSGERHAALRRLARRILEMWP